MRRTLLSLVIIFGLTLGALAAYNVANVPLADGFDIPVGQNGKSYYKARGVRPNGHLGEDWNGIGGGDTDLGDPIYCAGDGIVTFAQDYRLGWGNVVIIRSAYMSNGDVKYVDSLYGHLLDFSVREGQLVKRGQQIGRMGSNRGMYPAHLHFEMRKNINVGMYRSSFPRDWSVYWSPSEFVAANRACASGGRYVSIPVNTYASSPPPMIASTKVYTPSSGPSNASTYVSNGQIVSSRSMPSSPLRRVYASAAPVLHGSSSSSSSRIVTTTTKPRAIATGPSTRKVAPTPTPKPAEKLKPRRTLFRVDRFEDMKVLGYE